jgi:alpha-glucoside transport system permease protein
MLFDKKNSLGLAKAFINSLTVAIPSTIIPIALAAFAAYALAWMKFRGNALLITAVVVGLALPPHISLIPILKLHLSIGIGKSYLGMWLAHSAFTLPFAIFLLHNYMAGIPREIIENAKLDGATDFQIFIKIILPLSIPALASWAIIQFLWTFNDLLGPMVFLHNNTGDNMVMTHKLTKLYGMYSERWELIATSTFISMAVPLVVFLIMQRHFARGLMAGAIK